MAFSVFVSNSPRYDAVRNQYVQSGGGNTFEYSVNGAISLTDGTHRITKGSAAAMTVAAPTASDEGVVMVIVAGTAFAHVVTFTGGLGGNAADDVVTFAKVGDSIRVRATGARWVPEGAPYGAVIS